MYNGERYIEQQLLSIIAQTHKDWQLIIHDDGSIDCTVEIVKGFCKLDSRIRLVEDGFTAHNAGVHFMYMLQFADAPYVCFCDQDDIWFENKLEVLLRSIEAKDNGIPQVVFCDAYLYHDKTNTINGQLLCVRPKKISEILFTNGGIHGSASMFNAKMRECLDIKHDFVAMHDHILTLIGCSFGEVSYLDHKLFLYRQHQNNVTGNINTSIIARLCKAFDKNNDKYTLSRSTIMGVESFLESYRKQLKPQDVLLINNYLNLITYKPLKRFLSIISNGYSLNHSRFQLWVKVLTRHFMRENK